MIVLLECTCMISSPCILRWQCILGSIDDVNSNYLGNQLQTDQKIVVIGLKTPEFFLGPGGLRGPSRRFSLSCFFFFPLQKLSIRKNYFCLGLDSSSLCLGGSFESFFKMPNLPSQPIKLPVDLTATPTAWQSQSSAVHVGVWLPRQVIFNPFWCLHQWRNHSHLLNRFKHQGWVGVLLCGSCCSWTVRSTLLYGQHFSIA